MTKTFANYPDLTANLAFALIEQLKADGRRVEFGFSNQSYSAYANVSVYDDEDEYLGSFKVRFSDHADRHGADITIRIDELVEDVYDDCNEFVHVTIEDWRYQDALDRAKAAVDSFIAAGEFED